MVDKSRSGNFSRRQAVRGHRQSGYDRTLTPDPVETAKSDAHEAVKKFAKEFREIGKALHK